MCELIRPEFQDLEIARAKIEAARWPDAWRNLQDGVVSVSPNS
jgi:hypothetical protein